MSKVRIQGNASGTGIFTVAAPATNTDRTINLPDVDSTLLTTIGGTITGRTVVKDDINADKSYPFGIQNGSQDQWWLRAETTSNRFSIHRNGLGNVLELDSTGRITMPYQTYALCGFTNSFSGFTVSSDTVITMNCVEQRGNAYNTSNGRFTAPVAGLYHVFISLMLNPPRDNANRLVLRKNGSDYSVPGAMDVVQPANGYMQTTGGGSQQSNINLTCILNLNVGDYVTFAARSGSSVGPIYGGHSWGFFYLIG